MAVFRSRGTMPVVRDVLMMFVMVDKRMSWFFIKIRGGNGIEFTGLGESTVDYFKGKEYQAQKLSRDFLRRRYQGKQLGLEEENCF